MSLRAAHSAKNSLAHSLCRLLLCAALFGLSLFAQSSVDRGSIVGTVFDSSGSSVAKVQLVIENIDTGVRQSLETKADGGYVLTNLIVGNYRITATQTGFKKAVVDQLRLQVGAVFRADITMEVGEVANQVTVQASSPLIQSETSDVSSVIERKRVVDLPLNGRDFGQLQLLTPGAVNTMTHQVSAVSGLGGGASGVATSQTMIASNGARPGQQLYLIDGANATNRQGRSIIMTPSIDEIEEFRVSSSSFSAEVGYGSNAISVATRGGTNEFHGTLYNFLRNHSLNARNFFAFSPPKLIRNQFGGNFAGPIKRNKLFFFAGYEGAQERSQRFWLTSVPTMQMRGGNLSEIAAPIFDPLTSSYNANGVITRTPFPGNIIPAGRIDPISRTFLDWYPVPNRPGIAANFYNDPPFGQNFHQYNTRLDYRISDSDNIMGRFSQRRDHVPQQGPYQGFSKDNYNPGVIGQDNTGTSAVIAWNHIFNPTTTMEIRPSFARPFIRQFSGNNIGIDWTSRAGIQGFGPGVSDVYPTWPEFGISGFSPIYSYIGFEVNHTSRDLAASVTMIRGAHSIKFGNTFASYQQRIFPSGLGQGSFSYTGTYSSNPSQGGATGAGMADYLLGFPQSGGRYVPPGVYYIQLRNNWMFLQDDWKVSSRLTLNLGLRYELNLPTTEKYDQLATWVPFARGGRGAIVVPNAEAVTGDRANLHPSVPRSWPTYSALSVFAKDIGLPERSMRFLNKTQFAPRFGFAYRLQRDFVVRGGYGIYLNQLDGNRETEFLSPPFLIRETNILNSLTANGAPERSTRTLFPAGSTFNARPSILAHDPYAKDFGYTQQWNLFVQKMLPGSTSLEIGYVGTKGTRLQNARAYNTPLPGPGSIDARRPFQDFLGITWSEQTASSIYHALQVKAERRYSNGLTFLSSFTWSKAIDNMTSNSAGCLNPYDCRADRAVGAFDVPFVWTSSLVYDLPWLRTSKNWPVRTFIGGWTFSAIATMQSGLPYSLTWSGDPANTGQGSRPNAGACSGKISNPTVERWYDASCFSAPTAYTYGNLGRNTMRADGTQNIDFGLYKDFLFREKQRLQFRSELFNSMNHPSFGVPSSVPNAAGAGRVTSASTARQIQLALKYYF